MNIENAINAVDLLQPVYQGYIDGDNVGGDLRIDSIPKLDGFLNGLSRKKLVVVGGRTSQGKSTLLLQMAFDFAKQGKTVVFFSLEMTNEVVMTRLICNHCGIDNRSLKSGHFHREADKYSTRMTELNDILTKSKLVIIQSEGKTFEEVSHMIETLEQPVDAVFVDHIQQVKTMPGRTKRDVIDQYLLDLRAYAIQKNFCAIVGSQINRGTHDGHKIRTPSLWELKETGSLEEHSDQVILVHWESFYALDELDSKYLINVAKNRDGETGAVICQFEPQHYRLKEGCNYDFLGENRNNQRRDING